MLNQPLAIDAQPVPLSPQDVICLGERIRALHDQVRRIAPQVDRMACALYDAEADLLKTFVNSTSGGAPLRAYQYPLSKSPSLLKLAQQRTTRVIGDIPASLHGQQTEHSRWLLEQGWASSLTMPLFYQGVFEGFLFFDSRAPQAFPPPVVAQLEVYGHLVALMVCHEMTAVQALVGSVRIVRHFAHLRDVETGTHLDRMSRYVRLVARALAVSHNLSDEFIEQLFLFSPLHDIGKIGVPDEILRHPGTLDAAQRKIMNSHVTLGSEIVEQLVRDFGLGTIAGIDVLRQIVACHHEYLDGSGYPLGLRGSAVPMAARIVTVADIFDALSNRRVYKPAWSVPESYAMLDKMVAAGQLDADCVHALRQAEPEVRAIMARFAEKG